MKVSRYVRQVRRVRVGVASAAALVLLIALPGNAQAAPQPPVGLGTATSFAVLAGTTVTNTLSSVIVGNLGLSPGLSVTGFPPGTVTPPGTQFTGPTSPAAQAQLDLTAAYDDAAGRTPFIVVSRNLGGQTLVPGVYKAPVDLSLTGTVTLDAENDPNAVFIFQSARALVTASTSRVNLVNGASSCNVFWQVTSSATLGTDSRFRGTILALTSISLNSRATVDGRVLARNGAVTLQGNRISQSPCVVGAAAPITTATPTATPTPQVAQFPSGAVAAGDGSTSGGNNGLGLLAGVLVFAGVGSAAVVALRRRRRVTT